MKLQIRGADGERELSIPPGKSFLKDKSGHWANLESAQGRCVLTPRRPLKIENLESPLDIPRLLVPGDRLQWETGEATFVVPDHAEVPQVGTASVLRSLLSGEAPAGVDVPRLNCLTGLDMGHNFPLGEPVLWLGRGESCDLRLRDRAVSRRHARLEKRDGTYFLHATTDTPNAIFVNARKVAEAVSLQSGDIIELGRTLLRVHGLRQGHPERQVPAPPQPNPVHPELVEGRQWVWATLFLVIGLLGAWWGVDAALKA